MRSGAMRWRTTASRARSSATKGGATALARQLASRREKVGGVSCGGRLTDWAEAVSGAPDRGLGQFSDQPRLANGLAAADDQAVGTTKEPAPGASSRTNEAGGMRRRGVMSKKLAAVAALVFGVSLVGSPALAKCTKDCKRLIAREFKACKTAAGKDKVERKACRAETKADATVCKSATNPTPPDCGGGMCGGSFPTCAGCGGNGACFETAEGGAVCSPGFYCAAVTPCSSTNDCATTEVCLINTCCGADGFCATVCPE